MNTKARWSRVLRRIAIIALTSVPLSTAALPPVYGPEFEFGSKKMSRVRQGMDFMRYQRGEDFLLVEESQYLEALKKEILRRCNGCKVRSREGKWGGQTRAYRFTWPNGVWVDWMADPQVVEATMKPLTLKELREIEPEMQNAIFGAAKAIGLDPFGSDSLVNKAAGHFNIGAASAFEDGVDMLAFMMDFADHPELASGALGKDFVNAPPLILAPAETRQFFAELVNQVNEWIANGEFVSREEVSGEILQYFQTGEHSEHFTKLGRLLNRSGNFNSIHNQALSFEKLDASEVRPKARRLEIRSVRMQESYADFILMAELMEKRMEFVRKRAKRERSVTYLNLEARSFSKIDLVSRFYVYVSEAGLKFDKYKALLTPELRETPPDPFVLGEINWGNKEFEAALTRHLPYIARSPWLQSRARAALVEAARQRLNSDSVNRLRSEMPAKLLKTIAPVACSRAFGP